MPRFFKYPVREKSWKCWAWRVLFGPASIADGIVELLSFSFVGMGCRLTVSRNLARARIDAAIREKEQSQ